MTQLFLDLDGVFADFDGAFAPLFGFDHTKVADEVMWKAINDHGSYFRDLPVCGGALEFFDTVARLNPKILTACPREDFENVARQKIGWVREHLGDDVEIILSPGGRSKPLYMHRTGDILVDDFASNIRRWREAGGVGIHHTGNFAATLHNLELVWPKSLAASATSRAPSADLATTSGDTTTATASALAADITRQEAEVRRRMRFGPVTLPSSVERYSLSHLGD